MADLFNETVIFWVSIVSAISFIASLMLVPWLLIRIPEDYFKQKDKPLFRQPLWFGIPLFILRNCLGVGLLILGLIMLFIPGQGLLTILLGLVLMNYPGKFELERKILLQPSVLKGINAIRKKANRPMLTL